MTRTLKAELVTPFAADVGEGPQWDAGTGVLSFVDIPGGELHLCTAEGELRRTHRLGRPIGAAIPAGDGAFLLAEADGFSLLSADGRLRSLLPLLADEPRLRFNDAKADAAGRVFAGTMAYDKAPGSGTLYRLDPGPAAATVLTGLTVSNGMGWSPDDGIMWFADSAEPFVTGFAYDRDAGMPGEELCRIAVAGEGVPDGMCIDDDGGIWLALWGGACVRRYLPDGRLDAVVEVPARNVTSCAFGGPDRGTLFITTARRGIESEAEAEATHAGGLFAARPGVTGPAATRWQGHVHA